MSNHIDVFVSSTAEDLAAYRQALKEVILRLKLYPISMESFNPSGHNALQVCYDKVQEAEMFIGIYAHRYGYCPGPDVTFTRRDGRPGAGDGQTSITHWEYLWALERQAELQKLGRRLPVLLFLIKDHDAAGRPLTWRVDWIEEDPGRARLRAFKQAMKQKHVVGFFHSPDDLAAQATAALAENLRLLVPGVYPALHEAPAGPQALAPDDPLFHFKDRTEAIQAFQGLWAQHHRWVLAFDGFSGLGKSMLMDYLETRECQAQAIPYSRLGFENDYLRTKYTTVLDGLLSFAPRPVYQAYRDKRDAIIDRRTRQKEAFRQRHGRLDDENVSKDVAMQYKEIDQQAREDLTHVWLDSLAGSEVERLVFFLDTFELYEKRLEKEELGWFWNTLAMAHQRVPGLRVVIGSREKVSVPGGIQVWRLPIDNLSEADSDSLLQSLGVTDGAFRAAVYHNLARGHPLLTRFAADAWLEAEQSGHPLGPDDVPDILGGGGSVRDEALEWVHGAIIDRLAGPMKEAVRWAALLRSFNLDLLNAILKIELSHEQFTQLTRYSFIVRSSAQPGWACHDLVRQVQFRYLRDAFTADFQAFHGRAMDYYTQKSAKESDPEQHKLYRLEMLYHRFFVDTTRSAAFEEWLEREEKIAYTADHDHWERLLEVVNSPELELAPVQQVDVRLRQGRRFEFLNEHAQAEDLYRDALRMAEAARDANRQAGALIALGNINHNRSDYDAAIASYERAIQLGSHHRDRARAYGYLGVSQADKGEYQTALAHYQAGLALLPGDADRREKGVILGSIGNLHLDQGDYDRAREFYEQALAIARAVGDRRREGRHLGNLGNANFHQGNYADAEDYLRQALAIHREVGNLRREARRKAQLSNVYRDLGQYGRAQAGYAEALVIADRLQDWHSKVYTLNGQGRCYANQDAFDAAIDCYQQAEKLARQIHNQRGLGNALSSLGFVLMARAWLAARGSPTYDPKPVYARARTYFEEALAIGEQIKNRRGMVYALNGLGTLHTRLGEPARAIDMHQAALAHGRAMGTRRDMAYALNNLGMAYLALGDAAAAGDHLAQAVKLADGLGARRTAADCRQNLAKLALVEGQVGAARAHVEAALAMYRELGLARKIAECEAGLALLPPSNE